MLPTGVVHNLSTIFVDNVKGAPVFTGSLRENTFCPAMTGVCPDRDDELLLKEICRSK
jgi:hypothetical protein